MQHQATSITFQKCTSGQWKQVGEALGESGKLLSLSLSMSNCHTSGSVYDGLWYSNTLTSLSIGTGLLMRRPMRCDREGSDSNRVDQDTARAEAEYSIAAYR